MAKYYGVVAYVEHVETEPGIWEDSYVTRKYAGDVIRNTKRWTNDNHLNDNISISNTLSIVADPYAYQHFHNIIYVEWMGTKWKVTDVDVAYPRLNLTLGGEYHELSSEGSGE